MEHGDWRDAIIAAQARIRGHVRETPVLTDPWLWPGAALALKFEHMQHAGSFKARGAFNTLLGSDVPEAGVVAASGGNHGAAVAYAAARLGHPAAIFVPEMAGPAKIGLIREQGIEPVIVEGSYAEALQAALEHERKTGAMQVHAYDAPMTVAGQGTCFAEWDGQGLQADTVLVAVGGGGLISGAMGWWGSARKIVGVEPVQAPTLTHALAHGPTAEVDVSGVAANALGARRIGGICHELAVRLGIETRLVSDSAILEAQRLLWRRLRVLVEPAGAAALAALTSRSYRPAPGERVAVLICGANPAPDPLD